MRIDIVEIWFVIANGPSSSVDDRVICPLPDNGGVLSFLVFITVYCVCPGLVAVRSGYVQLT